MLLSARHKRDRKLDGDWQIRCREAFVVFMQTRGGQHSSKSDNFALAFINLPKNYPETQCPTTRYYKPVGQLLTPKEPNPNTCAPSSP